VDDVIVKTKDPSTLIADLQQTFDSLHKYKWKLKPTKCMFGVPSRQLLGFVVSHRGMEASTKQIQAITRMTRPHYVKDVQKLTGCMATLNRFISRLGEKGWPFFKLLKKSGKFKWTAEAYEAFQKLKEYLSSSPILTPPEKYESLLLYIVATTTVVSAVIVVEWAKEGHVYKVK
jgi:hypothetical protein